MAINSLLLSNIARKSILSKVFRRTPRSISVTGNAAISTSQYKFTGSSIALDGAGDSFSIASSSDFAFGTGNFCIEGWLYFSSIKTEYFVDFRTTGSQNSPVILYESSPTPRLVYYVAGVYRITYNWTPTLNTWYHVAVARSGTSTKMFVNGTQVGSTFSDTTSYVSLGSVHFGRWWSAATTDNFNGYMDDIRISKGIARYTTAFTSPTEQLVNDPYTLALLHFQGDNGSTVIADDVY